MIPPLQPLRLRSIERWLKDQPDPPSDLHSRALELDEVMIEAFEAREDTLKESMMRSGTWGTEQGMRDFPTCRMQIWNEILSEFLPSVVD